MHNLRNVDKIKMVLDSSLFVLPFDCMPSTRADSKNMSLSSKPANSNRWKIRTHSSIHLVSTNLNQHIFPIFHIYHQNLSYSAGTWLISPQIRITGHGSIKARPVNLIHCFFCIDKPSR